MLLLLEDVRNPRVAPRWTLFLAHCLIPNQQFVCTVLACVVCLPEDRVVTNSSSTTA